MSEKRVYLDDNHNYVSKEVARYCVLHEFDEKGNLKQEVWLDLKS